MNSLDRIDLELFKVPGSTAQAYVKGVGLESIFWNLYGSAYDQLSIVGPYQAMQRQVIAALQISSGTRILDLGSGTGRLLAELEETDADRIGIDISSVMLRHARKNAPGSRFLQVDINKTLPFADATFDRVASINSFNVCASPKDLLKEMHRVLRRDGLAVVVLPCRDFSASTIILDHLRRGIGAWMQLLVRLHYLFVVLACTEIITRRERAGSYSGISDLAFEEASQDRFEIVGRELCYSDQARMFILRKKGESELD